ncbi:DUF4139 domain-containing protein [Chryseobacterium sp. Leaf394]|uniref:DUF4139 domain-containing protein n=1 Tax=Chryseobacterium sp. Leaf394 TaxID=1736361 RepID=UPI0006FB4A6A|nr:DUF4139 domain-containing protein [Chryseobacterium sp. Leaf394]KQS90040.1 hypothetical protein ASG21_13835 [Chryseobacterium sp. Leaf394]
MNKFYLFGLSLFSISVYCQKPVFAEAELKTATVYEQSGELFSTTSFKIPKGSSEIIITNIAENIDQNSIKLGSKNKISILTYRFSNDEEMYAVALDKKNPQHKVVLDSIDLVRKQISNLNLQRNALTKSLEILDINQTINSGSTSYASEVSKLLKYNQKKRFELGKELENNQEISNKWLEKLSTLQKKFNLNNQERENYPKGKLILQVSSEASENVNMDIKYNVYNASWRPYYDVIANGLGGKINLGYKAMIRQNSGLDWKNVKLNLISGNPNQRRVMPELGIWQLYYQPQEDRTNVATMLQGKVPGVSIRGNSSASVSEISEVLVTGPRNVVSQNQLNLSYELEDKFTILSNNKDNSINLNSTDIAANFIYSAVPKYSNSAFLVAEIENLDKYNLIPAEANIVFEDTNVGKTVINPETTDSKMILTLGEDRRISIKRQPVKDKTFTKSISSTNKEQQFAFEITVRNNKSEKIKIKLKDQIPITTDKQIIITMVDKGNGEYDEKTGILTWNVSLNANETQKINFSYKVNSLKGSDLRGL